MSNFSVIFRHLRYLQIRHSPENNGKVGSPHLVVPTRLGDRVEVGEEEGEGGQVGGREHQQCKLEVVQGLRRLVAGAQDCVQVPWNHRLGQLPQELLEQTGDIEDMRKGGAGGEVEVLLLLNVLPHHLLPALAARHSVDALHPLPLLDEGAGASHKLGHKQLCFQLGHSHRALNKLPKSSPEHLSLSLRCFPLESRGGERCDGPLVVSRSWCDDLNASLSQLLEVELGK